MKLIVKEIFADKFTKQMYSVGDTIEITDKDRVKDLSERGLAEVIKEPKTKTKNK
ncbi:MAG: hypothetical protein Q4F70_04780 [Clostridia bacterium]|nr:hypothetical protein [Clostridia bacterium]